MNITLRQRSSVERSRGTVCGVLVCSARFAARPNMTKSDFAANFRMDFPAVTPGILPVLNKTRPLRSHTANREGR